MLISANQHSRSWCCWILRIQVPGKRIQENLFYTPAKYGNIRILRVLYGFLLILAPKSRSVFNKNPSSTLIEVIFPSQNVSGHRSMLNVECLDGMMTSSHWPCTFDIRRSDPGPDLLRSTLATARERSKKHQGRHSVNSRGVCHC